MRLHLIHALTLAVVLMALAVAAPVA